MSKVMVHPAAYENVRPAVERALELFPLDLHGKRVFVKPNVLRPSEADEGITTHPAVLRAVVEAVEARRPSSLVVGDNPGVKGYGANEEAFSRTGLLAAAKGYYRNIGGEARSVAFNPRYRGEVSVSRAALDADVFVSVPKFKTHGLTVVSGAIKNSFGLLPGAQKAALHRAAGDAPTFHELIVDVFRLRVPDLVIVDAIVGMEGNGPASRDLREVGLVLASDDAVALDAVIAAMMGIEPSRLRFLQRAKELGLGPCELGRIEVVGQWAPLPGFKLPPLNGEAALQNRSVQDAADARLRARPRVEADTCTGCGTCVDHCPVSALALDPLLPRVDEGACIACFCCQELCPEKAITLR